MGPCLGSPWVDASGFIQERLNASKNVIWALSFSWFPTYRDFVLGRFPCVPLKTISCSYSLQSLKKRNPLYLNSSNQSQRSFYWLSLFYEPTQTVRIEYLQSGLPYSLWSGESATMRDSLTKTIWSRYWHPVPFPIKEMRVFCFLLFLPYDHFGCFPRANIIHLWRRLCIVKSDHKVSHYTHFAILDEVYTFYFHLCNRTNLYALCRQMNPKISILE